MAVSPSLRDQVWRRANATCEYCRLPQRFSLAPFQIDHIISDQHGGPTVLNNLALACAHDNRHKGPNIAGVDPETQQIVPLFHPRRDRWEDHFQWDGAVLRGLTAIGRATIGVLAINDRARVEVREALIEEGVFPPAE